MTTNRFKTWELALLFALCFSLCLGTWAEARQGSVSASLIRLHVLAVDDSQTEQSIKLRVRDAVLEYMGPKFEGIDSRDEAEALLERELEGIKAAAETASEGRSVAVELGDEYYPTREYEGFTLPAGKYRSLRVTLGEGAGHNWWCVIFPPLCISAAEQTEAVESLDEEDYGLVTEAEGYKVKFRIVELWGEFTGWLEDLQR